MIKFKFEYETSETPNKKSLVTINNTFKLGVTLINIPIILLLAKNIVS